MSIPKSYNKIKNVLLIFLFVFIVAVLGYFLIFENRTAKPSEQEQIEQTKVDFIREAHLFLAGTDYSIGTRDEGEKITEFQKGDYLGVSTNIDIDREVVIASQILNDKGVIVEESPISPIKKEKSGPFGLCCALVPDKEGDYFFRLKINGTQKDIGFSVFSDFSQE